MACPLPLWLIWFCALFKPIVFVEDRLQVGDGPAAYSMIITNMSIAIRPAMRLLRKLVRCLLPLLRVSK